MGRQANWNRPADLGDAYNLYLLLLGRSPESRPVVREKAGFPLGVLFADALGSPEFRDNVLDEALRSGALPQRLFRGDPSPSLRRWAMLNFSGATSSDARIRQARSWSGLLLAVLSEPGPSSVIREVAGPYAETFLGALLKSTGPAAAGRLRPPPPGSLERGLHRLKITRNIFLDQCRRVSASGLFDADFYRSEYPDLAMKARDLLLHFMYWGAFEGRRPNALFDTHWYFGRYPNLLDTRSNPVLHYLRSADSPAANPNALFDRQWYVGRYPDLQGSGLDPLAHFIRHGAGEGRWPHPAFDLPFYVSTFPPGALGGVNPLEHYLESGEQMRHDPNRLFDAEWYIGQFPTSKPPGGNLLVHYLQQDADSLVDPSSGFSTIGYLQTYREVRGAGRNALIHYLDVGQKEGRQLLPARTPELPLRVAIIAETSLSQCLKYRVTQKQEMIRGLGYHCSVISWRDVFLCVEALSTHNLVIFYRVPAYPEVLEVMHVAKRAGLPILWEVDDLIFSGNDYMTNRNLDDLDVDLQRSVMSGIELYRKALRFCDVGIASTVGVADAMQRAGASEAFIVENALDKETISLAAEMAPAPRPEAARDQIVITYGSGGKTHDTDFRVAADAILTILSANRSIRLYIVGELNLDGKFDAVKDQITRFPIMPFADYLKVLAQSDIVVTPVEDTPFSDAKSNIKFLEAAVLGVPSICSPRSAYREVVRAGENGLLAESYEQWLEALAALIEDSTLRTRLGDQARRDVLRDYDPEAVARRQVAPILAKFAKQTAALRVLSVNTYYNPNSFGGATIVAEQMNRRLNARPDTQVTVFTGSRIDTGRPYGLTRDVVEGSVVFRVELAPELDPATDFDNEAIAAPFRDALRASGANVVHLHAIQGLGGTMLQVCAEEGVAAVVTLHDAWWICGRMFMVTGAGVYCGQWTIDVDVCAGCVSDASLNYFRQLRLRKLLNLAEMTLTPSAFFRDLYIANGRSPERIAVNRNGVQVPRVMSRQPSDLLRLGFVGGIGPIKGLDVIKSAMEGLDRAGYRLVLVDNTLNLGFSSMDVSDWSLAGEVQVVPAYTQATMDDFFSSIDVLLFPTQWKESFGLTVREALLRDVWVIVTDAGGVTEDVVQGVNGDVIPFDDRGPALRSAIERRLDEAAGGHVHTNPQKGDIVTFEDQAEELHALLSTVAERTVSPRTAHHQTAS